jgi:hypothetical protein
MGILNQFITFLDSLIYSEGLNLFTAIPSFLLELWDFIGSFFEE